MDEGVDVWTPYTVEILTTIQKASHFMHLDEIPIIIS